jgi:hypothetical protein
MNDIDITNTVSDYPLFYKITVGVLERCSQILWFLFQDDFEDMEYDSSYDILDEIDNDRVLFVPAGVVMPNQAIGCDEYLIKSEFLSGTFPNEALTIERQRLQDSKIAHENALKRQELELYEQLKKKYNNGDG